MAPTDELIPLSRLESELGISRVDLLLLIRRLGLEPMRRGMRTFLGSSDAAVLVSRVSADPGETVAAELVLDEPVVHHNLPVPIDSNWYKADLYADLRLFRERLEILERLVRTGIEVESRDLAELLQLKRLPAVVTDAAIPYFERQGLRFWRISRPGQRQSWKVTGDDTVIAA
jgi:hypothetical protein